jgi:hypothetical protein
MDNVKISWTNSKGETVSNIFPSNKADAIITYLETVVKDVDLVIQVDQ